MQDESQPHQLQTTGGGQWPPKRTAVGAGEGDRDENNPNELRPGSREYTRQSVIRHVLIGKDSAAVLNKRYGKHIKRKIVTSAEIALLIQKRSKLNVLEIEQMFPNLPNYKHRILLAERLSERSTALE